MDLQKPHQIGNTDPFYNLLVEVPMPLDPHSPRKRKLVRDVANLLVYYDSKSNDNSHRLK